jgi:hypothetical protein
MKAPLSTRPRKKGMSMKIPTRVVIAGAAILTVAAARPAAAQSQPDTTGLVRAVASIVTDSLIRRVGRGPLYVRPSSTPFDSAVAVLLRADPAISTFRNERLTTYAWLGTRGYTMRGDTAAVLVEFGTTSPPTGGIDTYIEENLHLFVRDGGGWRYVRREFVRGMDLGAVRG